MNENINKGVRCNVKDCVYNEKGCDCNRSVIEVSKDASTPAPTGEAHHFCKSYICKECESEVVAPHNNEA